jgi:signal transduction histidine kinase/ActR/RegA family two-component response regulator
MACTDRMQSAGRTEDEAGRLETLRSCKVLDTEPEVVYDDITRLLAITCDMPMTVISFVDEDRLWFKSQVGFDSTEALRELGFCSHTILQRDVLLVSDTLNNECFQDNPMVVEGPKLRFYAGTPIVMPNGHAIGAVAIMDVRPRELTREQRETLLAMGRQVASHLELLRRMCEQEVVCQRLQQATERLDLVIEAANAGIWDIDLALRSVYLSQRVFHMLGLSTTSGHAPLAGIWPLLHPNDRRHVARAAVRQLRRGSAFDCEFRCRHVVDGWRWYRARATAAKSEQGCARRLVGSLTDIHEQDPASFVPTVDNAVVHYVPQAQLQVRAAMEDARTRGRAFSLDLELVTARGRHIWVRATGGAVFAGGRAVRLLGAFQDITEQRHFDEELMRAKEAAESASESKSAFLAAMSHEIRTPMHTVLGYTDMLRDTDLNEEQRECVSIIASSGTSLLRLIDDILDFSKVEAGKMILERMSFDVHRVVQDVARMMQPQASQKGLTVRVETDGSKGYQAIADPQRVHQVLVNLAGNAVKFTAAGSVVFAVAMVAGRVQVQVRDTGIGIPADALSKLFQDFVQVDSSTQRRYGGTGLGLAISKQLVEAMAGTIGVTSEEGLGSVFWFELPGALEEPALGTDGGGELQSVDAAELELTRGRRVLVAEDNRLNLRLAVRVLETFGLKVDTALDGEVATQLACQNNYDLVLMDCLMPGVDGFEATRRIRLHEEQAGHRIPIIALTANALPEDREACLAAGMDDFVSKPFTRQALHQALMRWLTPQTT